MLFRFDGRLLCIYVYIYDKLFQLKEKNVSYLRKFQITNVTGHLYYM